MVGVHLFVGEHVRRELGTALREAAGRQRFLQVIEFLRRGRE